MKQTGRRIISLLLAALFLLPGFCLVAQAEQEAPAETKEAAETTAPAGVKTVGTGGVEGPELNCPRALCCDLEYDMTLLDRNADESMAPAGFTKLMTALLGYEYCKEAGDPVVTVTEEMISGAGGGLRLKAGEEMPLSSLLAGMVVCSANDAALTVACAVSGSVSAFVEKMNARAEELGMANTYYNNPTGVDSAMMHTTLRDTMLLCRALYKNNDFMTVSSEEHLTIHATNLSQERTFTNKNPLIPFRYDMDYMVRGARGFIAGYTVMAGYVCASCRQSGGANTIVLLAGGTDLSEAQDGTQISAYRDAAKLLDWARDEYAVTEVVGKENVLCEKKVRLSGGVDHTVLVTGSSFKALLPKSVDITKDIRVEIRTDSDVLEAPVLKGAKYGEADIYWGETKLGAVDLVAQANVSLSRFLMVWDNVVRFFSAGPAHVFLIIVISSAAAYLLILIITVWIQYLKNTRERRRVVQEIRERERARMRSVRMVEREQSKNFMNRLKELLREAGRLILGRSSALGSDQAVAHLQDRRRGPYQPPRTKSTVKGDQPRVNRASSGGTGERYHVTPTQRHPDGQRRPGNGTPARSQSPGERYHVTPAQNRPDGQRRTQIKQTPARPAAGRNGGRTQRIAPNNGARNTRTVRKWPE